MGLFERYLTVWVGAAIALGVLAGSAVPGLFQSIGNAEVAGINLIIAVLIWLMVYPMMVQIDFASVKEVGKNPKGLLLTVFINWLVKPFSMALVAWLFFEFLFADWVDPQTAEQYIAGMILLGVAPCTAMVFVWSQLTKGDASYTLVQVSVNDLIMVVAFAPIAGLLLGVSSIEVPWETLTGSVVLYVLLPLLAGIATRKAIGVARLPTVMARFKPLSVASLIATVFVLFGLQAENLLSNPLHMALIAIPLLLQTYGIFFLTWWLARKMALKHDIAGPACLIGTSNFFELAVAVAITLFGLGSGAALATVVGVLVEVPVMLSLVAFVNRKAQQKGAAANGNQSPDLTEGISAQEGG